MVLTASETRKQARESLQGKWGTVVLITLIYLAYSFIVGLLSAIPFLGTIVFLASIVIDVPIIYGFMMTMMKLKRGENVGYFDFFKDGFSNFKRSWCLLGRLLLKMIVPIILIIVAIVIVAVSFYLAISTASVAILSGSSNAAAGLGIVTILSIAAYILIIAAYVWIIIKAFRYALGYYLAIDNPNMSPLDCLNKSNELMNGNKGRLFCLYISFIGWGLLAAVLSLIPFIGWIATLAASLLLVPYIQFASIIFYENRVGIDTSATVAEGTVDSENTNNTTNTIQEKSGSQDVKAEIVDIPNIEQNKDENDEQ